MSEPIKLHREVEKCASVGEAANADGFCGNLVTLQVGEQQFLLKKITAYPAFDADGSPRDGTWNVEYEFEEYVFYEVAT